MTRAQSVKVNGAVSFWLPPWPGGSTRMTWCAELKWSACADHMSPVIRRLGQNIMASPGTASADPHLPEHGVDLLCVHLLNGSARREAQATRWPDRSA